MVRCRFNESVGLQGPVFNSNICWISHFAPFVCYSQRRIWSTILFFFKGRGILKFLKLWSFFAVHPKISPGEGDIQEFSKLITFFTLTSKHLVENSLFWLFFRLGGRFLLFIFMHHWFTNEINFRKLINCQDYLYLLAHFFSQETYSFKMVEFCVKIFIFHFPLIFPEKVIFFYTFTNF